MESWRETLRNGLIPVLPTAGLEAVGDALRRDDQQLMQGCTTTPPPLMVVTDWPVEGACFVGYCLWKGLGLETVGEVEEAFAKALYECDQLLGEPAGCRWWLNHWDDEPRDILFRETLAEVERALAERVPVESPADG